MPEPYRTKAGWSMTLQSNNACAGPHAARTLADAPTHDGVAFPKAEFRMLLLQCLRQPFGAAQLRQQLRVCGNLRRFPPVGDSCCPQRPISSRSTVFQIVFMQRRIKETNQLMQMLLEHGGLICNTNLCDNWRMMRCERHGVCNHGIVICGPEPFQGKYCSAHRDFVDQAQKKSVQNKTHTQIVTCSFGFFRFNLGGSLCCHKFTLPQEQ